jgi:hypothetical protein
MYYENTNLIYEMIFRKTNVIYIIFKTNLTTTISMIIKFVIQKIIATIYTSCN